MLGWPSGRENSVGACLPPPRYPSRHPRPRRRRVCRPTSRERSTNARRTRDSAASPLEIGWRGKCDQIGYPTAVKSLREFLIGYGLRRDGTHHTSFTPRSTGETEQIVGRAPTCWPSRTRASSRRSSARSRRNERERIARRTAPPPSPQCAGAGRSQKLKSSKRKPSIVVTARSTASSAAGAAHAKAARAPGRGG